MITPQTQRIGGMRNRIPPILLERGVDYRKGKVYL